MEDKGSHEREREDLGSTKGLAARLRRLVGENVDPQVTLGQIDSDATSAVSELSDGVLKRLRAHGVKESRYVLKGEVARGGMGVILKAWDEDLRRDLAMKVVIDRSGDELPADQVDPKTLCRFLEEAQITGQLDHPGVVPVHELGLDAAGHVYFTMRLIKGRNLKHVFDLVHKDEKGWTVTRALNVLLKVCEAMAYAHAKGVIHRDLKPANIMVGRFGEVYVMDWGLARVIGAEDRHDIRINRELMSTPLSVVTSERQPDGEASDEALVTMDGDIVGTPAYISPEQGRGEVATLDARTDVYSMGCMLYQLLAGQVPFMPSGARIGPHMLLMRVLEGPPKSLASLAPRAPAELIAICEKAMAREPADRYWTADDLASDLRAYLDGRVVRAYESGALAEIKKWVVRNKLAAAASFLALAAVFGGLLARNAVEARSKRVQDDTTDVYRAQVALTDAAKPWPSRRSHVAHFEDWLERSRALVSKRDHHEQRLDELKAAARSSPDFDLLLKIERVEGLLADLDRLRGVDGDGEIDKMEARLEFALSIEEAALTGQVPAKAWAEALESIADASANPHYGGLRIAPQPGLIPIGQDQNSRLWEFGHLESGALATRDESGRLEIDENTGLVLVLIPSGAFWMGAQATDEHGQNYDPQATAEEGPPRLVAVDAFFLSRYEMTQGQWVRIQGENPSSFPPGGRVESSLLHPVETMSWYAADATVRRIGLELPSEEQWEYACRAGTNSSWWFGDQAERLAGVGNVSDQTLKGVPFVQAAGHEEWSDGHAATAPVGSYAPNPWGLHDIHGNVHEWMGLGEAASAREVVDPLERRFIRGGGWKHLASVSRSSFRHSALAKLLAPVQGLRPSRAIE